MRLSAPQLLNIVLGGKTPVIGTADAAAIGFTFVLYANAALQGAILGMQTALKALKRNGVLDESAVASSPSASDSSTRAHSTRWKFATPRARRPRELRPTPTC